ncbi:transposase [Pseudomonas sp.]
MAKAVHYLADNWSGLEHRAEADVLSIDDNVVERVIKSLVIGRKS